MSIELAIEKQKKEIKILEENISVFVDQIRYKKDVEYLMDKYGFTLNAMSKMMDIPESTFRNWFKTNPVLSKKIASRIKNRLILIKEKIKENEEYKPDF